MNLIRLRTLTMVAIGAAFTLEVTGGYLYANFGLPKFETECFSLAALLLLCGTAMLIIFRLPHHALLKASITLATLLAFFSQGLGITETIDSLQSTPPFGAATPLHDNLRDLSLLSGFLLMLVVAFLALIEALAGEQRLAVERAELAAEVEERKRAEQALEQSREDLRQLSLHIETAREEERKRISREIHDELGQSLTILRLDLATLEQELGQEPSSSAVRLLNSMSTAIGDTMASVRRIIAELRPGILDDLGLVPALEWQAREFQRRTGMDCEVQVQGHATELDPKMATVLFRIFQEALTNVARHAQASRVETVMDFQPERVRLSVRDNGRGISPEDQEKKGSFGLRGMHERVRQFSGEVEIDASESGTTVSVSLLRGAGAA